MILIKIPLLCSETCNTKTEKYKHFKLSLIKRPPTQLYCWNCQFRKMTSRFLLKVTWYFHYIYREDDDFYFGVWISIKLNCFKYLMYMRIWVSQGRVFRDKRLYNFDCKFKVVHLQQIWFISLMRSLMRYYLILKKNYIFTKGSIEIRIWNPLHITSLSLSQLLTKSIICLSAVCNRKVTFPPFSHTGSRRSL